MKGGREWRGASEWIGEWVRGRCSWNMGTACRGNTVRVPGVYKTSQHNKINRIKVKLIGRLFLCAVIFFFSTFWFVYAALSNNTQYGKAARIEHFIPLFFLAAFGFSLARARIHTTFPIWLRCIESVGSWTMRYVYTPIDWAIAQQIHTRIGWFLQNAKRKRHFMQGIGHKHQSHNISK